MKRGEIWWLAHPDAGRRPACILTRDEAIPVMRSVVVALLTRTRRDIPSEVALDADDGMPEPCVVSLDNVDSVPKILLVERITTVPAAKLARLCDALDAALGC